MMYTQLIFDEKGDIMNGGNTRTQLGGKPDPKSSRKLIAPLAGRKPGAQVSWSECDNQLLRDAIVSITNAGAAIVLGRTSDAGAFSITVLNGTDRVKEWPHTVEELEQTLRWLVAMFEPD